MQYGDYSSKELGSLEIILATLVFIVQQERELTIQREQEAIRKLANSLGYTVRVRPIMLKPRAGDGG